MEEQSEFIKRGIVEAEFIADKAIKVASDELIPELPTCGINCRCKCKAPSKEQVNEDSK